MTRFVNRVSALCVWVAAMVAVWAVLVPVSLSVSSFAALTVAGPVLLIAASALWEAHEPAPSYGQARVEAEAAETVARGRR